MTRQDIRPLKAQAKANLAEAAYSPKKLFLIYSAVAVGISVLLTVLDYFLNLGIDATAGGGLNSVDTQALLQTIQQLLSTAYNFATPFWSMGLVFVALLLWRKEPAKPTSLLEGFRKLGPVLRMLILLVLLVFAVAMGTTYIATFLLSLTALSSGLNSLMSTIPENATETEIMAIMEDPAFQDQMLQSMVPILIGIFVILLVVLMPFAYRLRMASFIIMDNPSAGARHAIKTSWKMTKGNCLSLFVLDLSFWWLYLLEAILVAAYVVLPLLQTPLHPDLMLLISEILYAGGTILLTALVAPYVHTCYAAAYDLLKAEYEAPNQEALPPV